MKILLALTLSTILVNAFADEDLAKSFNKLEDKDCTRLLSGIRKRTRISAEIYDKVDTVQLGTNKTSKFALLYLKLKNGEICSELPSRTEVGTVYVKYICRDKTGKTTLDKNENGGPSECKGDSPKFN